MGKFKTVNFKNLIYCHPNFHKHVKRTQGMKDVSTATT